MQQVLTIVGPIFGLIGLGYLAGQFAGLGREATKGLADFTFTLAIPAMLFRAMVTVDLPDTVPYRIWGAFFLTAGAVWLVATILTRVLLKRPAGDAPAVAMSAGFGNVVMLGIPLVDSTFGPAASAPAALIVSLHSPLLWMLASLHMALTERGDGASAKSLLGGLLRDLSRNAIVLAVLLGSLWRFTGIGLDPVAMKFLTLLGQAAIPCALASLGLSLTGFEIKGQIPTLTMILVLKTAVMPLIAWLIAVQVFHLPPISAGVVVLFAAMPTGANAYLFANRHGRATNSASGAIALGTMISILTATAIIYLLRDA